jgi:Transcriptional regulatory protein, C terminal
MAARRLHEDGSAVRRAAPARAVTRPALLPDPAFDGGRPGVEDGAPPPRAAPAEVARTIVLDVVLDEPALRALCDALHGPWSARPVMRVSVRTSGRVGSSDGAFDGALGVVSSGPTGVIGRVGQSSTADVLRVGEDVVVDLGARTVRCRGELVELRPKEFDLLEYLLRAGPRTVPRRTLLREVWGYDADIVTRTLDSHVHELRRKLERDPARPRHILTVRRVGYRLQP